MRLPTLSRLVLAAALFGALAWAPPARTAVSHRAHVRAADLIERQAMFHARAGRSADAHSTPPVQPAQVRPAKGKLTGWFGELRRGHVHTGVDIDGETGDPVVAAVLGTVSYAGEAPKGFTGYGLIVIIDHDGFQTLYAHLSRIDAAVGQTLAPGAPVGAIGTTGSVTGSHLHFEVRVDGKPVDPVTVIHVL